MGRGGFGLKGRFRWSRVSCLIRVTSWIVSFVRKTKDDPRSHTNQHEAKHSCLELVPTFEANYNAAYYNTFRIRQERCSIGSFFISSAQMRHVSCCLGVAPTR